MKRFSHYLICLALGATAFACGDDSPSDGDASTDASKPDATPDADKPDWDGGGCETPEPPTPGECSGDFSAAFVLYTLTGEVADYNDQGDPTLSQGFDLDCTEGLSCNCQNDCGDFSDGAGASGIDNQFAFLYPVLNQALSLSANLEANIKSGDLLLIVKLDGLDSETLDGTTNDDCVDVSIVNGVVPGFGAPELDGNENLAAGQTFNIDSAFVTDGVPNIRFTGSIASGTFSAGPATIPVSFPVGDAEFALTIQNGQMEATFSDGALTSGLIGGVLDVETTLQELNNFDEGLGDPGTLVANLLYGFADNVPDLNDNGACTAISAVLGFDSRTAMLGEVVDKVTPDGGVSDGGAGDAGVDASQ